jgi:hypothetical protein
MLPDGTVRAPVLPRGGRSKGVLIEHVIRPYERRLEEECRSLRRRFPALASALSEIRYGPTTEASANS